MRCRPLAKWDEAWRPTFHQSLENEIAKVVELAVGYVTPALQVHSPEIADPLKPKLRRTHRKERKDKNIVKKQRRETKAQTTNTKEEETTKKQQERQENKEKKRKETK